MKKTFNWQFWDWKSILRAFLLLSFLSFLLAFVFLFPDWNRKKQSEKYTGSAQGYILSIKPLKQISMGHDGNKTVTHSYSIQYSFRVKSKTYEVSEHVPATIKIQKALNRLEIEDEVTIRYDAKNPQNCQIDL